MTALPENGSLDALLAVANRRALWELFPVGAEGALEVCFERIYISGGPLLGRYDHNCG